MTSDFSFGPCSPFFIVTSIEDSLDYYVNSLGFECRYIAPEPCPVFAIVGHDSAQLMLKTVPADIGPLPNRLRHPWARWDAFVFVETPDNLAASLQARGAMQGQSVTDTDDGLTGFELADPDGYVCFFGHPR